MFLYRYQKFRGPPGPNFQLVALRAGLTSSFVPFGHSGRVTHATMWSFGQVHGQIPKISRTNPKNITNKSKIYHQQIQKISPTNPINIANKSNKYRQQIQKISPTNPKNIITNKSENDHQQIQKFPNPNPSPPPFLFHYILLSVLY